MENTKVKVKTSKQNNNYFHFNFAHGTTNKFMEPSIPLKMEVVAGSKMKIKMDALRRVDPMPLPPMSYVKFNTRFYYVPMIDICPHWYELKAVTPYAFRFGNNTDNKNSFIPTGTPKISSVDIKNTFFHDLTTSYTFTQNPQGITFRIPPVTSTDTTST